MKKSTFVLAAVLSVSGTALAVDHDEAIDGDLSNDRLNPTPFTLDPGSNNIRAQVVESESPGGDLDYFSITIPSGFQLDEILLLETSAPGFDNRAFLALMPGDAFLVDPTFPDVSLLTGFILTNDGLVGTDILDDLGETAPVTGVHSFWLQQTGLFETTVELEFRVSEIPTPGALAVFGLAGCAAVRRRR